MWDVVHSGIPWKMALYGEEVEHYLSVQEEEPVRTFWQQKELIGPCEYPIDRVRKSFFIVYLNFSKKNILFVRTFAREKTVSSTVKSTVGWKL